MDILQIYKASAGSGKTHLLTQSFLKLAFESPDSFSKILAVTFTNKAAEEMKTRIIEEINNIIDNREESPHFTYIKKCFSEKSENQIVNDAILIRDNILHSYSRFNVSTIDSFVQKVIRAFSYEISVSSNYDLELNSEKVIFELTDLLYKKISKDKELQKWLIKFAEYKIDEGKSWDFRKEIGALAFEIFREQFQSLNSFSNKDNEISEKDKLNSLLSDLMRIKTGYEKKMHSISDEADNIIKRASIFKPKEFGAKFNTIVKYLTNSLKIKKYEPFKTIYDALDGFPNWHAKSADKEIVSVIHSVYENLYKCIEKAVYEYDNNYSMYLSAVNTIQNFHSFGILKDIAELLPEYRNDNNLLLISDTTLMLKEIIGNNDAPFIYEKIGNRFKYILIDEFQDTSGFQWANFKPLIENALSEGLFNLIVGDIKQSIYRWRGGNWKLLLKGVKEDIGDKMVEEKSLETNWRSKKNIIDFNNSFFKTAPAYLQQQYNKELETIGDDIVLRDMKTKGYNSILNDAYSDNYQNLPDLIGKKGGRVKIQFIQSSGRSSVAYKERVSELVPENINYLLKNKNYEARDIAILVRTNRQGKEVVDMLLNYQENVRGALNYEIISAESLFISNSRSVKILVNALKFLYDEKDSIHLCKLIYEYQNFNNNIIDYHSIFTARASKSESSKDDSQNVLFKDYYELLNYLPNEFIENVSTLKRKSLFELTESLISIFGLEKHFDEFPYIQSFQDLVLSYTKKENSDLNEFIYWWDETGYNKSVQISDKQNAVKIMTIHKSKGLAFRVVLIPFADWNLDHGSFTAPLVWAKSNIKPFNLFEYLPVKYKSELAKTVFREDYFDEKLYSYMDALNMLYVAFTRPKEELIVFAPVKEKMTKIANVGDLLFKVINENIDNENKDIIPLKAYFDDVGNVFESADFYKEIDGEKFLKDNLEKTFTIDSYPNNDWTDKLKINYNSEDFFIESIEYIAERVNYGALMHQILAKIETVKDIEDAIDEMLFAGYITKSEKFELKIKIVEILSRPDVKPWFSSEWDVITENAILSGRGDLKIPDRVLINEDKVIVIDFKFGEEREADEEQIKEYKKLLEEIYSRKVEAYLYYAEKKICMLIEE